MSALIKEPFSSNNTFRQTVNYFRECANMKPLTQSVNSFTCLSCNVLFTFWIHRTKKYSPQFAVSISTQQAFYVNLHRAVIGPSATLTGRWRPDIDLRRMLTGYIYFKHSFKADNKLWDLINSPAYEKKKLLKRMRRFFLFKVHSFRNWTKTILKELGPLWNLGKWSSAHVYARGRKQCCKLHYCLSIKPRLPFSYL